MCVCVCIYGVCVLCDLSFFICGSAFYAPGCLQVPVEDCDDDSCMTFVFTGETHTLGNALRYVVTMK